MVIVRKGDQKLEYLLHENVASEINKEENKKWYYILKYRTLEVKTVKWEVTNVFQKVSVEAFAS